MMEDNGRIRLDRIVGRPEYLGMIGREIFAFR